MHLSNFEIEYDTQNRCSGCFGCSHRPVWHERPGPCATPNRQPRAHKQGQPPQNRPHQRQKSRSHCAARHHRGRAVKVDLDKDDGRLHYDVDIVAGRRKYDVEEDAHTGRIIKSKLDDTDWDDRDDRDDDRDD